MRTLNGPLGNYDFSFFSLREGEDQKEVKIEPAQAVAEVEPLPEDYYTRPVNLTEGNFIHSSVPALFSGCVCFGSSVPQDLRFFNGIFGKMMH